MSSSPHIFFIRCFYPSDTLKHVVIFYALISCGPPCVSPKFFTVACNMRFWITDASIWYTGIPAVFICGGCIYGCIFGHCWVTIGVGHWCTDITMWCIGKSCLNCECSHRLVSGGSIPKKCAWGKKGLILLSLHCLIMHEQRKVSAYKCVSDVYVLSISLS